MLSYIREGWQLVRDNKKIIAILYFTNLLFGIMMVIPLWQALYNFGGYSVVMRQMAGTINMDFVFDFIVHQPESLAIWGATLIVGLILYQLIQLFLSGGIFATFLQGTAYTPETFWGNAARYWPRFIRLFLWSLIVVVVFGSVILILKGLQQVIWGKHPYETVIYWNKVLRIVILQLLLITYFIILDFSRLLTIRYQLTNMRTALMKSVHLVRQHPFLTIGLGVMFQVFSAAFLLIYNYIADSLRSPFWIIILLLFLWQQAYLIVRITLRLTLYGAETALYKTRGE